MRDHTKLRAFERADELAVAGYRVTRGFPADERFGLTAQIRRAAVSIPSNIVQGCARETHAEYVRFLGISYASSRELQYQVSLARRLEFLSAEHAAQLDSLARETSKVKALRSTSSG